MSGHALRIAVVGHTNTGKTSLLRTLLRAPQFGEVSARPATTRHVQRAVLMLDGATLELYDTPGLERSIELMEHLEALASDRRTQGVQRIERFLQGDAAEGAFAQEAKVLRQVLQSDLALYVVDVRDPMLAKHRDELTALSWCARPIVPVLNFVKSPGVSVEPWREGLRRVGLHTIAEFDAVVRDLSSERQLLNKIASVLDEHAETLEIIARVRRREHDELVRGAGELIADLLIDAAAHYALARADDDAAQQAATDRLRQDIRTREQRCVERLFELFGFDPNAYQSQALPLDQGQWGLDLFSPEAAKRFGAWTGGAAATGAAVGMVIDVSAGGLTLGTGTALGAATGAVLGAGKAHGRRLMGWWRGYTELRCDDQTLRLLASRQIALVRELLHRGHAALGLVSTTIPKRLNGFHPLPKPLRTARGHAAWSSLQRPDRAISDDPARAEAADDLTALIRPMFTSETTTTASTQGETSTS